MIVYKITNKVNGKTYIGQTITSLNERWKNHCAKSSSCRALSNAIAKYGRENFTKEIVDFADSLEDLNKKEEFCINKFNSLAPNGYNLKTGGDQPRLCAESIKKVSESKKGMKAWNEGLTKDDPRVAKYVRYGKDTHAFGKVGYRKGKKHTEKAKRKMSEWHSGRKLSEETKKKMSEARKNSPYLAKVKKKVLCIETGIVYESISDASRKMNISISEISNACNRKRKQAKKYTFKFTSN